MFKHLVWISALVLLLVVAFDPKSASAQGQPPPLPQAFLGLVEVNGQPAPPGAMVEARGTGVLIGTSTNPITVTVAGKYGGRTRSELKLGVQGNLKAGQAIEFYVDGVRAQCARPRGTWQDTFPYEPGVVTELNLRVGSAAAPTSTATVEATVQGATATATTSAQAGVAPTATRQGVATLTPVVTPGGTPPAPTPAGGGPSPTPMTGALVTSPTPVGGGQGATPAPVTPVQPAPATATPEPTLPATTVTQATATQAPATPTPALVASGPVATARPVQIEATAPTALEARSESASQTSEGSGRSIALWAGLGVLLIGVAAFVIVKVRGAAH